MHHILTLYSASWIKVHEISTDKSHRAEIEDEINEKIIKQIF